ncbi:MAG: carbohydrate ABC transporter permease, partial [Natronospirillum sp.]
MSPLRATGITIVVLFFSVPTLWMFGTAFKPAGEYISTNLSLWPAAPTWLHFSTLLDDGILWRLWNTVFVAVGTSTISLVFGFLAAYGLVRFRFPSRLDQMFLLLVLLVKMMPPIV